MQNLRGEKPNTTIVHHAMPDGALDGASKATNHPHSVRRPREIRKHGIVYAVCMALVETLLVSNIYLFEKRVDCIASNTVHPSYKQDPYEV